MGARGLPVEILIDRAGRVVAARHGYGYKKAWARKLEAEIRSLLTPPATPAGPAPESN